MIQVVHGPSRLNTWVGFDRVNEVVWQKNNEGPLSEIPCVRVRPQGNFVGLKTQFDAVLYRRISL
jgi:hypothetical protein